MLCRRARLRPPSTKTPPSAAQAGATPSIEVTTKPAKVRPSTTRGNTGAVTACCVCSATGRGATDRSALKSQRNNKNSIMIAASHGSVMSAAM